jgi:mannosyl-oligosaccharide alpha-1,2-mannosidase
MYSEQPTGLAAEIATFAGASKVGAATGARHSLLRPETVESLFVLWRTTGNARYREWGWAIFQAIETHCKVESGGYSGLQDVTSRRPLQTGKMESFFTAETLKYLYLLFGENTTVPLEKYVFNTEAHPLEIHPDYHMGAVWGSR